MTAACRFMQRAVSTRTFVDLGMQPLSNAFIKPADAHRMEPFYPLHAYVCDACLLVQLPELQSPERIFTDYAYLSSMSDSWLEHCGRYAGEMIDQLALDGSKLVVEVASNDGYLLRFFKERGVGVLGVEPAANVAEIAVRAGVPSVARFFGSELARELVAEGKRADLLVGNNVLAHVPDLNDFVRGLAHLLAPGGVLTMEFPHLGKLLAETQFDTIYHEHFSYFSFGAAERVFAKHGIVLFDVEQLPTHGGSLRIHGCHAGAGARALSPRVAALRADEERQGLHSVATYARFSDRVRDVKFKLLEFLIARRREGKRIVAYGAAAKGNTLLNYCGIRTDFLDYVADRSPLKQGKVLPGTHIPVSAPERIRETQAGLRPHPAVEPQGRDRAPARLREGVGGQAGRPQPGGRGPAVIFRACSILGAFVVEPEPHVDDRGSFARVWCAREFEEHGLDSRLVQSSVSKNARRGTLRGMHYSVPPHAETKVVRCVRGAVFDVLLDLRPDSATFGTWFAETLSAENGLALYVPEGVAHGFLSLEDSTDVLYQMSEFFHEGAARGVRWNDPAFSVRWPEPVRVISVRDGSYPDYHRPTESTSSR